MQELSIASVRVGCKEFVQHLLVDAEHICMFCRGQIAAQHELSY